MLFFFLFFILPTKTDEPERYFALFDVDEDGLRAWRWSVAIW